MNNLKDYRIRKLMSQKELARVSGVSQVTISFAERDLSATMDLTKQRLSIGLKIAKDKLFPPEK